MKIRLSEHQRYLRIGLLNKSGVDEDQLRALKYSSIAHCCPSVVQGNDLLLRVSGSNPGVRMEVSQLLEKVFLFCVMSTTSIAAKIQMVLRLKSSRPPEAKGMIFVQREVD